MMHVRARYLSCFLMLAAVGIVTWNFFSKSHFVAALHAPLSQTATPYWFAIAGIPVLAAFGWSNFQRFRASTRLAAAWTVATNWNELATMASHVDGPALELRAFVRWADKVVKSSPQTGVPPDCEGWLQRNFDATPQQTTIRTITTVLIVLGVVFTFQGINQSTQSLTAAIGAAKGAEIGLLESLTNALRALSSSFGANLNGILFAIDFFVLGLCVQTLDEDARRVIRVFVLDVAEPLLQSELAEADPTHLFMQNQIKATESAATLIVTQLLGKLPRLLGAATNDALADTLKGIDASVAKLADRSAAAAEEAARETAKHLASDVSATFNSGVDALKEVIDQALPIAILQSSKSFSAHFAATIAAVGEAHRKAANESAEQVRLAAILAVEPLDLAAVQLREAFETLLAEQDAGRIKNEKALNLLETQLESTVVRVTATLDTGLRSLRESIDEVIPAALQRASQKFSSSFAETVQAASQAQVDVASAAAQEIRTITDEATKGASLARTALDTSAREFAKTFAVSTSAVAEKLGEFHSELEGTATELKGAADELYAAAAQVEKSTLAQAGSLEDWRSATEDFMAAATSASAIIRPLANTLETLQSNFGKQVVQASDATTQAGKIQEVLTKLAASLEDLPQQLLQVNTELAATNQKLTDTQSRTTAIPAAVATGFQNANEQFARELKANFDRLAAGPAPEFAKQLAQLNSEIARLIDQLRSSHDARSASGRGPDSDDTTRPSTGDGQRGTKSRTQPPETQSAVNIDEIFDDTEADEDPAVVAAAEKDLSGSSWLSGWKTRKK